MGTMRIVQIVTDSCAALNSERSKEYLLLLADKKEDIPNPFAFLACHNGDQLSEEAHKELLMFIKKEGVKKGGKSSFGLRRMR